MSIVRQPNLDVTTKKLLHWQFKITRKFQCHISHGNGCVVKVCKQDNFTSHNSIKLSFTNIQVILNLLIANLSQKQTFLLFLIFEDLIDSSNFSVRGCLSLTWKNSDTHIHSLTVYVQQQLIFACDLSQRFLSRYVFDWIYFIQCCTFFVLSITVLFFVPKYLSCFIQVRYFQSTLSLMLFWFPL